MDWGLSAGAEMAQGPKGPQTIFQRCRALPKPNRNSSRDTQNHERLINVFPISLLYVIEMTHTNCTSKFNLHQNFAKSHYEGEPTQTQA